MTDYFLNLNFFSLHLHSCSTPCRHFAAADARKFEEMWLMIEAEVKQLVERALVIDSMICKQQLGLSWEKPSMAFMEFSGPTQPQKQAHRSTQQAGSQLFQTEQALQCSQGSMETEGTSMRMYKAGRAVLSESSAEVETLSMETLKKVMELLCDEAVSNKFKIHVYYRQNL